MQPHMRGFQRQRSGAKFAAADSDMHAWAADARCAFVATGLTTGSLLRNRSKNLGSPKRRLKRLRRSRPATSARSDNDSNLDLTVSDGQSGSRGVRRLS
jgi:hypothetical protein